MSAFIFMVVCVSLCLGSTVSSLNSHVTSQEFLAKYHELKANNTKLQKNYDDLHLKFEKLENMLSAVVNKTINLDENNKTLFRDVHKLQDQVKIVAAKTFVLDSNARVRNFDVGVLYNKSAESEKELHDLKIKLDSHFRQLDKDQNETMLQAQKHFDDILNTQNATFYSLKQTLDSVQRHQNETAAALMNELVNYETRDNHTYNEVLARASSANEKVGITACVSVDGIKIHGSVIKFDEVRTHVGYIDLDKLRNTGVFTCEKDGLYQISVVINTPNNARFSVHINGNIISTLAVSSDDHVDSGTSVVAVSLQIGDRVWVEAETTFQVYYRWSCMTVVKL